MLSVHCLSVCLSVTLMYCGYTDGWIKMTLGTKVGVGPGDIELDGDPAPPKRAIAPQFSAHVRCGQMAGWIKMPLGTEVGFGPGHIVLDGDPAPPKGAQPSTLSFRRMSIVAKWLPISASAKHLCKRSPKNERQ